MESRTDADRIAVGIVGLGSFGRHLAGQFRDLPNASLVAVSEYDDAALQAAGEVLDVPPDARYTDYERMLDDAALDAVVIATPNGLHYDQATAALDRGLAVLCEKPLATDAEDAYDLTMRAEESEATFMVGYQRHVNPAYDLARERWALGDRTPRFVTGEITQDWRSYYETMENWRMDPDLSGGGHLLNVGTHVIDAILWTTGLTPTHVTAHVDFHDDAEVFDRQSALIIEFEEGTVATVSDTGVVARTREHVHIWDEAGAVYLEGREWESRSGYTIDADGSEHRPYHDTPSAAKARAFLESIRTGAEPPSTARDGCKATLLTLAAYESGRSEERVELTDLYPFAEGVF